MSDPVRGDDQARGLRRLAGAEEPAPACLPALAVTGGKGGVGKTCLAVNLSLLLARMGLKPLLVDCDLGLANADVLLGLNPATTLYDVVIGDSPLGAAIIEHPSGLALLPAASGREELTRLSDRQLAVLVRELDRAAAAYDLLILDTAAGIHREVTGFLRCARTVLVVITPDPTSLTDAYALIKVLEARAPGRDIRVVVNQAGSADEAVLIFNRLRKVTTAYLGLEPTYLGQVPNDRRVREAVRRRRPFATDDDSPATQALKGVAVRLRRERWRAPGTV